MNRRDIITGGVTAAAAAAVVTPVKARFAPMVKTPPRTREYVDQEICVMMDRPYFTIGDIKTIQWAVEREGLSLDDVRMTFGQRHDLSGTPFQLYGSILAK